MTTDEEISRICPSLIHFVVTLEQQFITIDDLLTEEAVDPFTDNATALLLVFNLTRPCYLTQQSHTI
jgi:hypothetical protein